MKPRLKKALGGQVDLNDLTKVINAAKKEAKQEDREPTHDELAGRWLTQSGDHAYGQGEWKRYAEGIWSSRPDDLIKREIKAVLVKAKSEGINPTSYLLSSVVELARVEVAVADEVWDSDPDILVCRNGALHVPTRELRSHSKAHYASAAVPYDYNPLVEAPAWQSYLRDVFDLATATFLQEFAGYSLTTDVSHEIAVWVYGPAGGGKSTLILGFEAMLGPKRSALSLSGIERSRFGLSNVKGKTLLTATEQPGGYVQASDTINTMISGEPLEIEEKWKAPYEIHPRAKFLWAMNELPRVHGANNGLFRRVKLLRMEAIPEDARDPEVKKTIAMEGAGILNWALDGLERFRERGYFEVPQAVRDNTRRWQLDSDPPSLFFMERCEVGEEHSVGGGDLYLDYQTWCAHNGYKPKARNKVSEDWRRLGLRDEHTRRGTVWHGARLQGPLVRI